MCPRCKVFRMRMSKGTMRCKKCGHQQGRRKE